MALDDRGLLFSRSRGSSGDRHDPRWALLADRLLIIQGWHYLLELPTVLAGEGWRSHAQLVEAGVSISTVGLGGLELGPEEGEEPDVDRATAVIERAREAGINWVDTSENYLKTGNESLIGAALGRIRGGFLVATKAAPSAAVTGGGTGFRRDRIHAACRASLRRLGRDHIDLYFLHWPDDTGVPLE